MTRKPNDKKEPTTNEEQPVVKKEPTAKNDVPVKDEPLNENEDKNNQSEDENNTNGEEESDASNDETKYEKYEIVKLEDCRPFAKTLFNLYKDQKLTDMIDSIREHGIDHPITLRPHPKEEGKYEIISGHNRVEAAKQAGLKEIKAVIKYGLTNEEAENEVFRSNTLQRSPKDYIPSEMAAVFARYYDAQEKRQGFRSDRDKSNESTSDLEEQKLQTRQKSAREFGVSESKFARYMRADKLIQGLKSWFDENVFGINVAETLSNFGKNEQEILDNIIGEKVEKAKNTKGAKKVKITIKQAEALKKNKEEKKELTEADIREILKPKEVSKKIKSKIKPIKLNAEFLSQIFTNGESEEAMREAIIEGVKLRNQQNNEK